MDATHTQPWFILADPDARGNWRVSSADGVVATVGLMPDAARIVAVINAMSGIEDPAAFVAEANRLIAEEADLLAMPDAEVVPQETVDRILGITPLRASHERLRAALEGLLSDANPNAEDLEMLCREACIESEYEEETAPSIESLRRTQLAARAALASIPTT